MTKRFTITHNNHILDMKNNTPLNLYDTCDTLNELHEENEELKKELKKKGDDLE